ncbi:MAG: bifunctional riboflavin kinase/FAD synthetase [Chloroflexi bacterium]|nr:bifunctional riboflavin kinase/FAD synthetase [Chloroflexota bacterium]
MLIAETLDTLHLASTWLAVGSFDGVHRGHQEILQRMVAEAHRSGANAVVLTFFPHPAEVLRGPKEAFYLTSPEEKSTLLAALGIDTLVNLTFTRELANLAAADFMSDLKEHLDLRQLWVGFNFALGRNREGDIPTLQRLGDLMGFTLAVIPPVTVEGETVSSSQIRGLLSAGMVDRAAAMLGRHYRVEGTVQLGDGRGRKIGIPTANLSVWSGRLLPGAGVYACWAHLEGDRLLAVANIGSRPTFEAQPVPLRLEAHLLDFDRDLYGQTIGVEFIERLRPEHRFSSVEELVAQIRQDISRARGILQHEA